MLFCIFYVKNSDFCGIYKHDKVIYLSMQDGERDSVSL